MPAITIFSLPSLPFFPELSCVVLAPDVFLAHCPLCLGHATLGVTLLWWRLQTHVSN